MRAKIQKFIILILILILLVACSFLGGIFFDRSGITNPGLVVNSRTIVNKINNEAIVLSKTIYLNQSSTVKVDKGSDWSNFWWGQTISAEGMVRVDLGVNYQKLREQDVQVDQANKKIRLSLPTAEILNSSTDGQIKVTSQSGVLKFLLQNDPNGDFNLAQEKLKSDARDVVTNSQTPNFLAEARVDSAQVVRLVLAPLGYELEVI